MLGCMDDMRCSTNNSTTDTANNNKVNGKPCDEPMSRTHPLPAEGQRAGNEHLLQIPQMGHGSLYLIYSNDFYGAISIM